MKTLRITSLAAVTIGIISIILSGRLKGDGGLASSHSFGYTTFGLGLITFFISLFESRKKKALALLISGMTLVVFGEKIPALFIFSLTRENGASKFIDLTPTFFVLGAVCVVLSWIILVIDSKE